MLTAPLSGLWADDRLSYVVPRSHFGDLRAHISYVNEDNLVHIYRSGHQSDPQETDLQFLKQHYLKLVGEMTEGSTTWPFSSSVRSHQSQ
jgi:hypothetical protein